MSIRPSFNGQGFEQKKTIRSMSIALEHACEEVGLRPVSSARARGDMPLLRSVSTWVHCAWLAAEWPADVAAVEWRHAVPVPAHD